MQLSAILAGRLLPFVTLLLPAQAPKMVISWFELRYRARFSEALFRQESREIPTRRVVREAKKLNFLHPPHGEHDEINAVPIFQPSFHRVRAERLLV